MGVDPGTSEHCVCVSVSLIVMDSSDSSLASGPPTVSGFPCLELLTIS